MQTICFGDEQRNDNRAKEIVSSRECLFFVLVGDGTCLVGDRNDSVVRKKLMIHGIKGWQLN